MEHPATKEPREPNLASAAYYSVAALFSFGYFILDPEKLPLIVAAPVFFAILSAIVLLAPFIIWHLFSGLATGMFRNPSRGEKKLGEAFRLFAVLAFSCIVMLIIYQSLEPSGQQEIWSAGSLGFFAFFLLQLAWSSMPGRSRGKGAWHFLCRWAERAGKNGIAPGLITLALVVAGALLFGLVMGTGELQTEIARFVFYFVLFAFLVMKTKGFLKARWPDYQKVFGKKTLGPRTLLNWHDIALSALLALAVHSPISAFAGGMGSVQLQLFAFAFAYAATAWIEATGGMRKNKWMKAVAGKEILEMQK